MNKISHIPFSVCMSVYKNDNADDFLTAVHSVTDCQTIRPHELILVIDGPIPDSLEHAIQALSNELNNFIIIRFEENKGHAAARQAGIDAAHYDIIAIMDSDDIALPDRFEKQLHFMVQNADVDVVGGQITEFIHDTDNIVGKREVPLTDAAIKRYMRSRCPMNLMTIMAHKESIMRAGGFINWFCEEDYYLWIRMMQANCTFANIDAILSNVRVGKKMYQRRGGWKYFKSERGIQQYMFKNNIISYARYLYNVAGRFIVQVIMPNWLRGFVFQKLFRK